MAVMTVIAITRELGSLGRNVAIGLSERLSMELVHHELVEKTIGGRLNRNESDVNKFLEAGITWLNRWGIDSRRLGQFTAETILELASRGNVILRGWGAAHLLSDFPDVLRIRVCAPMSTRETVVMERTGIQERDTARKEIEANDAAHAGVIPRFFGGDWQCPENYDIVLNTERLSVGECIDQILQVLSNDRYREIEASRQPIADKLLQLRIQQRLTDNLFGGHEIPGINVLVSSGEVVLDGYIQSNHLRKDIERVTQAMPGVMGVSNNLEHLRGTCEM